MRKFCVFLCMFLCSGTMALAAERVLTEDTLAQLDFGIARDLKRMDDEQDVGKMDGKSPEFQQLKADAIAECPELEKLLVGKPERMQPVILRGFLAQQTFNELKSRYITELTLRSYDTGRAIKSDVWRAGSTMRMTWHLDAGELDEDKCNWDFEKRIACDYPPGFEEYRVQYEPGELAPGQNIEELTVDMDIPEKNIHRSIQLSITKENFDDADGNVSFDGWFSYTVIEYKYDEYYVWQNQNAQDIRDGIMVRVPKTKGCKKSPFGCMAWQSDDTRDWKSQHIPEYKITMIQQSFFYSGSRQSN